MGGSVLYSPSRMLHDLTDVFAWYYFLPSSPDELQSPLLLVVRSELQSPGDCVMLLVVRRPVDWDGIQRSPREHRRGPREHALRCSIRNGGPLPAERNSSARAGEPALFWESGGSNGARPKRRGGGSFAKGMDHAAEGRLVVGESSLGAQS